MTECSEWGMVEPLVTKEYRLLENDIEYALFKAALSRKLCQDQDRVIWNSRWITPTRMYHELQGDYYRCQMTLTEKSSDTMHCVLSCGLPLSNRDIFVVDRTFGYPAPKVPGTLDIPCFLSHYYREVLQEFQHSGKDRAKVEGFLRLLTLFRSVRMHDLHFPTVGWRCELNVLGWGRNDVTANWIKLCP